MWWSDFATLTLHISISSFDCTHAYALVIEVSDLPVTSGCSRELSFRLISIRTHTYSLPYMRLYNWSYCNGDTPTTALMTFIELIRRNVELHWHSHSLSVVDFAWVSRVYWFSTLSSYSTYTHTPLTSPCLIRVIHDTCLASVFSFNQLLYAFICISYELNWFAYARVWVTEAWWLAVSRQVINQPTTTHTHSPPQLVWLHEMIWLWLDGESATCV